MATPAHTPSGRGYDTFLGYFQHANGYWDKQGHIESTGKEKSLLPLTSLLLTRPPLSLVSVGNVDLCLNRFTDLFMENETYRGGVLDSGYLDSSCSGSDDEDPACYEEHIFKSRTLEILDEHDPSSPLFLFHSFHLLHTPLNVPNSYLEKVDAMISPYEFDSAARRNYSAMVHYMDDVVGDIVAKLKDKGMYDDTVIALMADNGGPVYLPGAANNHPLKGGKYSDWEGGVRTNALISGGQGESMEERSDELRGRIYWTSMSTADTSVSLVARRPTNPSIVSCSSLSLSHRRRAVPPPSRGSTYANPVSIADWFGMFCDLFGVDSHDSKSEAANEWMASNRPDLPTLPSVDAVSGLFSSIMGQDDTNYHPFLPISPDALLSYPYKIVTGVQTYTNYTGLLFPNCSTLSSPYLPWHNDSHLMNSHLDWSLDPDELDRHLWASDCGASGCLYNVETDPNETTDLAEQMPDTLDRLRSLLDEHRVTIFEPDRGVEDVRACQHSASVNGGYYGPWLSLGDYYTGPFRKVR